MIINSAIQRVGRYRHLFMPRKGCLGGAGHTTATRLPHQVHPGGVTDKGDWTAGTAYVAGDMVHMGGYTWVASCDTTASPATMPGVSPCWERTFKPKVALDFSTATITPKTGSDAGASTQFLRASTATVLDYQGNLVAVAAAVPRFQGARYGLNVLPTSEGMTADTLKWTVADGTLVNGLFTSTKDGGWRYFAGFAVPPYATSGETYALRLILEVTGVARQLAIEAYASTPEPLDKGTKYIDFPGGSTAVRYDIAIVGKFAVGSVAHGLIVYDGTDNKGAIGDTVKIVAAHMEPIPKGTVLVPEYIRNTSSTVPAYKAFEYFNGNTVNANGIVTEAKGAPIPGITYLNEPAATNLVADQNVVNWQKGSGGQALEPVVQAKPGQAPGGGTAYEIVFGGPSSGLIPSDYATVTYALAADTQTYTMSLWIRKISGPGNAVLMRGRANPIETRPVTAQWQRISVVTSSATAEAPFLQIGIWGADPAYALPITVQVADGQIEVGNVLTSYIPTAGAAATRAADDLRVLGGPQADCSLQAAFTLDLPAPAAGAWRPFGSKDARGANNEVQTIGQANWTSGVATGGLVQGMNVAALPPGKHCFGAGYANTRQSVYLNGQQVNNAAAAWTPAHSNQYWQVGRWGDQVPTIPVRFSTFVLFAPALPEEETVVLGTTPFTEN